MNVEKINNKRKKIVTLSLTITIILFIVFVVLEVYFGFEKWWGMLLCFVILIICLYLLSKLIVIPLYNKLVVEMFKSVFEKKLNNYEIKVSKDMQNDFYYLVDKNYSNISNHIKIIKDDISFDLFDFVINKKNNKDKNNNQYGKYITITLNNKIGEFAYVMQNKNLSKYFDDHYKKLYKKSNYNFSTSKKYLKYNVYYNDSYDFEMINLIEEFYEFNSLICDKNKIYIFLLTKEDGFNFKLQDNLNNDIGIYLKEKYNPIIKMIEKFVIYLKEK